MISAQLQVERMNIHVRVFALHLSVSPSYVPRLVDYVQYLHVIGQTTLDVLGNIKILARLGPVKMAHMATLSSLFYSVYTKVTDLNFTN